MSAKSNPATATPPAGQRTTHHPTQGLQLWKLPWAHALVSTRGPQRTLTADGLHGNGQVTGALLSEWQWPRAVGQAASVIQREQDANTAPSSLIAQTAPGPSSCLPGPACFEAGRATRSNRYDSNSRGDAEEPERAHPLHLHCCGAAWENVLSWSGPRRLQGHRQQRPSAGPWPR